MNMPNKRGPKPKKVHVYYHLDEMPDFVDQGYICNLLGITKPTFRKMERAGMITRNYDLAHPPEGSNIAPIVRYERRDVFRLVGKLDEENRLLDKDAV